MFSRFTRLPLRRCLHTSSIPSRPFHGLGRNAKIVLGASAVSVTYMTWRLMREASQISLDSPSSSYPTSSSKPIVKKPRSEASTPSEAAPSSAFESTDSTPPEPNEGELQEESPPSDETPSSETGAVPSGGAFNPQTGEINWDCPCLGGMAHGPCGPEFREAFSCFVFSEDEPKGINCVEKFQAMQTCFRAHPEVYADEIMDDDDDEPAAAPAEDSDVPPSHLANKQNLDDESNPGSRAASKPQLDPAHISGSEPS